MKKKKKNLGYDILKQYNASLNGNDVNSNIDPVIISCYKQCPITSVDVEQVFSRLIAC